MKKQIHNKTSKSTQKATDAVHDKYGILYHRFAKLCSDIIGHAFTFILALLCIIIWLVSGPFFKFSDTWQLIINTATTIITFLIVFLIQNTLNRENEIMQIKLDELIKIHKKARNTMIDLDSLSDSDLKKLEEEYNRLSARSGMRSCDTKDKKNKHGKNNKKR